MDTFFILAAKYLFVFPIFILGVYFFTCPWLSQKRMALFAVPAGLLTYVFGVLGNYLYFDPRPFVAGHVTSLVQHAADNGFPSDHTLLVASLAAVGMYWNKWLGVSLWCIAILVAAARVYVGLHHFVDVLASILIALIAVSVWYVVVNYVWKK